MDQIERTCWCGKEAVRQAMTAGRDGGPGFETYVLRPAIGHDPKCVLERSCGSNHFGPTYQDSWDWRMFRSDGTCVLQRLTRKESCDDQ